MNTALWIVQILLGAAFIGAGAMKIAKAPQDLIDNGMAYVEDLSPNMLRFIGAVELLAGIGLILPPAVNVLPILAAVAAAGLVVTMIGAAVTHVRRNEYVPSLVINGALGGLALFVAIGRFGAYAF